VIERYDPFDGALGMALGTRSGSRVYTAGMVGICADGSVPEDLDAEVRQAFANLKDILETFGASFEHVVEQTTFVAPPLNEIYPVFQTVRNEIFRKDVPASTSVGVAALLDPRFHIETKLVAELPDAAGPYSGTRGAPAL
jgi:enamine deaminase RidA (YjgF/YER057c/UK114 family)